MVKYNEEKMNQIFHALADPTRREIIRLVSKKDCQASELAQRFQISFPAVSKHLKVLEKAEFIHRNVDGRIHRFAFNEKTMRTAYRWIDHYKKFWLKNLDQLGEFLNSAKKET